MPGKRHISSARLDARSHRHRRGAPKNEPQTLTIEVFAILSTFLVAALPGHTPKKPRDMTGLQSVSLGDSF